MATSTVSVSCPLDTNVQAAGHISLDLQDLTLEGKDAQTWTQFVAGLRSSSTTIGGKVITSSRDAMRYLLLQMRGG